MRKNNDRRESEKRRGETVGIERMMMTEKEEKERKRGRKEGNEEIGRRAREKNEVTQT